MAGYERDRQRLRDLEIGNKRPASRNKRASYASGDKGEFNFFFQRRVWFAFNVYPFLSAILWKLGCIRRWINLVEKCGFYNEKLLYNGLENKKTVGETSGIRL